MHFAYPPRKNSDPPPFLPRSSKFPTLTLRRSRAKVIALAGLAFIGLLFLILRPSRQKTSLPPLSQHIPSGKPPAVLVTVYDETNYPKSYLDSVRENRKQYAARHGYETFSPRVGEYDLKLSPLSWTKVVALRDAVTKFPEASYFWYLDQDSFIMNPDVTVQEHIMSAGKIEGSMIKDHPVVPPDSIIKTFTHLKGDDVDLVLSQDKEGLSIASFFVRNTDWTRFFFETWFDPIYRSYNFQKAEAHALEHIVQWHPTILSKLALVPQRMINSYSKSTHGTQYEKGDFSVRLEECVKAGTPECEAEAQQFARQWREAFKTG